MPILYWAQPKGLVSVCRDIAQECGRGKHGVGDRKAALRLGVKGSHVLCIIVEKSGQDKAFLYLALKLSDLVILVS